LSFRNRKTSVTEKKENIIMKLRNLLLLVCLACSPATADDLSIVLDSVVLATYPGQQVTFTGDIFNDDMATLDLNDISISLGGMFTVDTTPFFSGPATVPGQGGLIPPLTGDFALFNVLVDIPYTDPLGIIFGTLSILGGVEGPLGYDPTTENFLGSTSFGVAVVDPPASAPEPSAFTLILTGVVLLCAARIGFRAKSW
jgi:hypothetical protein